MPASKNIEVSDGIENVPPIIEVVGDQIKETTQSNSNTADINPNEDTTFNIEEEVEFNNNASQESYQQNKETQQSNSNNADKNSYRHPFQCWRRRHERQK